MTNKTFGQPTLRVEDRDLLCGNGRFINDIQFDGMLHAGFARRPMPMPSSSQWIFLTQKLCLGSMRF